MKTYVAGPMSGLPQHNVPAFLQAFDTLSAKDVPYETPADFNDLDLLVKLLAGEKSTRTWEEWLEMDLRVLARDDVSSVTVLPGWTRSRGARLETFFAHLLGKRTHHLHNGRRIPLWRMIIAWGVGR